MTRPLRADPKQNSRAARWHREVIAMYGNACYFCGTRWNLDAAHVIPRSQLGKHRYALAELGRPVCRRCHDAVHAGDLDFAAVTYRLAKRAANRLLKVKLR